MASKHKIINDPVYDGFLSIDDPLILKVIDHPYFQRLRRIKQLGMADLVYPGAVHTRFSHCLGALNLMCRALEVLKSKGVDISEEECQGAKLAILLHDIGHGPGSHVLESTIVNVSHETLTKIFMERINSDMNGQLDLALAIFTDSYHKRFLHQLVSSQLDMDRLDYLSRDSYFTGVREGIVGTDRIIYMLNVKDDELVVDEKGIYSVEQFLISRRLMYWQVYMHKTVVAAEIMLKNFFARAVELREAFESGSGLDTFIRCDHRIGESELTSSEDMCSRFAALDDSDLYQCLKQRQNDSVLNYYSLGLLTRKLASIQLSVKPFEAEQVKLLRKQYGDDYVGTGELHNRSYDFSDHEIKVLCKDGRCLPIGEVSDQLDHSFLEKQVTKHYLYFPKK